ncbi:MAG: hypothetical protein DMF40_06445 [Verrucomicrobia bacterium]|nr:MAG: hypothetical protein DMF40_06445 [Verrucomicrobiota bacterium]
MLIACDSSKWQCYFVDLRTLNRRVKTGPLENARLDCRCQTIHNISKFKQLVESLADLPAFTGLAEVLRDSVLYSVRADAYSFPPQVQRIQDLGDQFS